MRFRPALRALPILALAAAPLAARADYACAVSGGGSVNFLVYNPTAATPTVATSNVTLTCSYINGGVQRFEWTMSLSNGTSGNCNARAMNGPGGTLGYNIFQGSIAGGVWGNGGCATEVRGNMQLGPGVGNGTAASTQTLYGQIPINQFVAPGVYSENLTLTINF